MEGYNSGIYRITCVTTGKVYIGSAVDCSRRKSQHLSDLRKNKHQNRYLQRAFNKYLEVNFIFEVIEYVADTNNLISREQYYLDINYDNKQNCFNISPTAGSILGFKFSEDSRRKISESHKGKKHAKETIDKFKLRRGKNHPLYGKPCSEETKHKISLGRRNIKATEETKIKMSIALKGKYTEDKHSQWLRFSNEEMLDMKLRHENGESLRSIARSYNTDHQVIKRKISFISKKAG